MGFSFFRQNVWLCFQLILTLIYCLFQVNLIEWLKMMVTNKRAEEVVDPNLEDKPPKRALKRAILVGFKCVDPDADKRPKMSHVVQMLEAIQNAYHQVLILSYTSFFLSTIFFLISTVLEHLLTSVYFFLFSSHQWRIKESSARWEAWILNPSSH